MGRDVNRCLVEACKKQDTITITVGGTDIL